MLVPGLPVSAARPVDEHQRHQLALARLHQRQRFVTLVHRAKPAGEQRDGVGVPDEDQLAGKEILEGDQLLVLANDRVGRLFPGQTDVGAKALLRAGALVSGLHDARARAGNDHEPRPHDLAAEVDRLLVFRAGRRRPGGAEHGDLAHARVRCEELERETQLAQGGLDNSHVAAVLHVLQQLQRVLDNVRHAFLVETSALVINQLLNAPRQLRVHWGPFCSYHGREDNYSAAESNRMRAAPFSSWPFPCGR